MQSGSTTLWSGRGVLLKSVAALALVSALSLAWLASGGPTAQCGQVEGKSDQNSLSPVEVVASPWYGPHHVYAVFQIPGRFAHGDHPATLKVADYLESIDIRTPRNRGWTRSTVSIPGHYPMRVYLPTRIALRLLVTGHFGDLRVPCNWALEIAD